MQIVIDISDEDYKRIKDMPDAFNSLTSRAYKSIKNGTPLPKGHGDLVDKQKLLLEKDTMQEADTLREYDILFSSDVENAPTVIKADKEEV